MTDCESCPLKKISLCLFVFLLCVSPTSSPFTSLTLPPSCPFDAPKLLNLCVYPYSPRVFTSDFLSFLYPSFIHICLKSLSSPLIHPAHLNNPLTVFIHLFFCVSIPVFPLSNLYFTLLPVLAFFSPTFFLFIIHFLNLSCLFHLFYLSSFISFHYFP